MRASARQRRSRREGRSARQGTLEYPTVPKGIRAHRKGVPEWLECQSVARYSGCPVARYYEYPRRTLPGTRAGSAFRRASCRASGRPSARPRARAAPRAVLRCNRLCCVATGRTVLQRPHRVATCCNALQQAGGIGYSAALPRDCSPVSGKHDYKITKLIETQCRRRTNAYKNDATHKAGCNAALGTGRSALCRSWSPPTAP